MQKNTKVLILIPSRYQSSRFPAKSLALVTPKNCEPRTLVEQVYQNCAETGFDVAVVTDNDDIEKVLTDSKMKVVRVDDDVASGTERIAIAYQRYFSGDFDLIINVQGDEPLLKAQDLKNLIDFHEGHNFEIATLVREHTDKNEIGNPNIVKVAYCDNGRCLYFSRSPIPFERNTMDSWYQHIGVYSYKPNALMEFVKLKPSQLELIESLEQLRALESGMTIGAIETSSILMGVDTPDDLDKVNKYLQQEV